MAAEVREQTGEIRGVKVRWVNVIVAGHTVEQILSFDVAEAEAVHKRSFDDEMDKYMQMGMFAVDRIAADGTMHKVASAASYVLDGKCIRTAKIEHCMDIEPMGIGGPRPPWSCVPGTQPMSHAELFRAIAEAGQVSDAHNSDEKIESDPNEFSQEENGEFFDILLTALSRVLRDLAMGPPETHHREWILFHLKAFIQDEVNQRRPSHDVFDTLVWFHQSLTELAEPVEPPIC